MRSDAAIACCRLALTRLSFFAGPYISSSVAMNDVSSPIVSRPLTISRLPYHSATAMPMPPSSSISGGRLDERRRHLHVRAEQLIAGPVESLRLLRLVAERLDDAMAGEAFGADVRELLERFLTAPRRPPHALAEPDQRIDDERRADDAEDREPGVVAEQQRRKADERERLAREIAERFRHRLLHLADVVVDPRHQLAGRALREEAGRLSEDVAIQRVAQVHHDALSDVGHQVRRPVRSDALEEREADDRPRDEPEVRPVRQHVVDHGPDERGDAGRADRVDHHRRRPPSRSRPRYGRE